MDTFIILSAYLLMAIFYSVILGALKVKVCKQTDLDKEDEAFILFTSIFWPITFFLVIIPFAFRVIPNPLNFLSKKLLNLFQKDK